MKVWVRGAGELASATALTLHNCGFQVLLTELALPLAIRRTVTFSDALLNEVASVEGVTARRVSSFKPDLWDWSEEMPIGVDDPMAVQALHPDVVVDARMLKRFQGDFRSWAPLVIGLGPGFEAGVDCSAVIETQRGHDLGRVIWSGTAQPNTNVPGKIGGETRKRVLYAPADGVLRWDVDFGTLVDAGAVLGWIGESTAVRTVIGGLVRGLISPAVPITRGLKIADVDPRGRKVDYRTLSDKARSVARGCLEAILVAQQRGWV